MILVFAEVIENEIQDLTYELVALAKQLGDYKVVVVGAELEGIDGDVIQIDGILHPYHYKIAERLFEKYNPEAVLFANAPFGMDLAPQLAGKLGIPLVTNVVKVENGDRFKATSLVYGGRVLVDLEVDKPAIFVVNRGYYEPVKGTPNVKNVVIKVEDGTELLRVIKPEEAGVDISKADVVVSVGRGAVDSLDLAEELAELLKGVIAGSRPVIDQGLLPKTRQVGRSGKTVTGKLYLALGISGATEHVEGVKAKNIIAVNIDRDAPIFRVANVGVIADVNELLPVLIEKVRKVTEKP
ncbi:electron transfer flavoprotein subunit alpha/FixB family protein [Archaeoglobus profundus]|uniref:Electron transfer flavoprotein alpha subunit n=1 Tax=Archaeoglobus profundus (strain DSM 5631 / JCM 9629 / NBRC 100127 / Av18) TaxID=572546 RepID=D2RI57_ARCPA|nr:electron transfer flavoprotein subunit alpha/FixB family protein [Archaeoglobus profundus]ADB57982.1 Electron transfer flavoprotein alpha subunit [Archaeoglobus profundus DSM 5631]